MPVRTTILSLIPKHYYRTSVQRQIRCCGVLLQKPEKKESLFQTIRNETERWEVEAKQGKKLSQFLKEFNERLEKKELEESPKDGNEIAEPHRGSELADKIKNEFQTRLPRFSKLFFCIRDGLADLYTDFFTMVRLYFGLWRGKRDIHDFNLQELEIAYEVYLQIKKMLPVFLFAILPLGNIFLFTAAYMRPLMVLTPHFWSAEQKATFIKQQHASRVAVFLPIIQYLEIHLPKEDGSKLVSRFEKFLLSIQEGTVPNPSELASFRDLFCPFQTFSMEKLPPGHLDNLMTLHGQRGIFTKLTLLDEWASYMHLVDQFIKKNGGVTALSSEQLAKYCFQRGANADVMSDEEMRDYLRQWIALSENISSDQIPLLLHAPALIGFNHKSNQSVSHQSDDSLL